MSAELHSAVLATGCRCSGPCIGCRHMWTSLALPYGGTASAGPCGPPFVAKALHPVTRKFQIKSPWRGKEMMGNCTNEGAGKTNLECL